MPLRGPEDDAETPRDRVWQLVLEPGHASRHYWSDLWRYRELIYFLAWRDIVVRYKQTAIGVAWAVLRPAATVLVFVAFRRLAGLPSGPAPEAVLVLAGILPWQFFATALTESSVSLIGNASLISKVYFPRLAVPLAAIVTALVDFLITLGLLALVMAWYSFPPDWSIVALPLFVLLVSLLSLGMGVWLAALNVEYRDFRYVVPFVVQFGLFVSPVAFTLESVPVRWQTFYALNPLVGIIEGFRWSILGAPAPLVVDAVVMSTVVTVSILCLGIWYFRRVERNFADVI
jgi:lipopolysaccharide transport system permease protein